MLRTITNEFNNDNNFAFKLILILKQLALARRRTLIYCSLQQELLCFEKEHKIISKLKGRLIIFGNKACMHFATHNMMKNVPLPPPDEKQSRGNKSHFSSTLKGARTRPLCLCNLVEIMLFHNNVYIICLSKGTYIRLDFFSSFSCNVPVSIHISAVRTRNKLKNNEAIFSKDIGLTLCRQLSVSVCILRSTSTLLYSKVYLYKNKVSTYRYYFCSIHLRFHIFVRLLKKYIVSTFFCVTKKGEF